MRIGLNNCIVLPQCNSQQIINQFDDDMSFIVRAKNASVDNLVAILQSFRLASALEINWHNNMVYWCG